MRLHVLAGKVVSFCTRTQGHSRVPGFSKPAYEKYFVSKPARSCFEVAALPKGALIEIEAVAVVE